MCCSEAKPPPARPFWKSSEYGIEFLPPPNYKLRPKKHVDKSRSDPDADTASVVSGPTSYDLSKQVYVNIQT